MHLYILQNVIWVEGGIMRKFGPDKPPQGTFVDEEWYLSKYPDVKAQLEPGLHPAAKHFLEFGWREGRLPRDFKVDEEWYLATYPDVAEAIKAGQFKNAYDHFMQNGYGEGRKPNEGGV
jgi:hypothetical protein